MSDDRQVVVAGAGAAGMAAALACANAGLTTTLIESQDSTGGTMSNALLHTLAGLYDAKGDLINQGLVAELVERLGHADSRVKRRKMGRVYVLSVDPEIYRQVTRAWLIEAGVQVHTGTAISAVAQETPPNQTRRKAVRVTLHGAEAGSRAVSHLVDATGGGRVVSLLDASLITRTGQPTAAGFVFAMRGVAAEALTFPRNMGLSRSIHAAAAAGELPADCARAWVDVGLEPDEVYVKLFVPLHQGWREAPGLDACAAEASRVQELVAQHLSTQPGFEGASVHHVGSLGIRDDGGVECEYRLTEDDVRGARKFEDVACRCVWPIEHWDSQSGLTLEYLEDSYDIPLRSLQVKGYDNVWTAGKSLSAEPLAQASARCVGTCWAMGDAVARAIATRTVR